MRYKQARTQILVQEVGAIYLLHNRAVMFLSSLSPVLVRACAHLQIHICSLLRPVCVWACVHLPHAWHSWQHAHILWAGISC